MNLTKDEKIIKCEAKWKKGVITDTMISIQSEVLNENLEQKFKEDIVSCMVKCCIEYFGKGALGDYTLELHINNVADNDFSVQLSSEEENAMLNLSSVITYTK